MSKDFNRALSNGIAQGREDSRWMRERIAELETQKRELVRLAHWAFDIIDEFDVADTDNVRETLAKIDKEKGDG